MIAGAGALGCFVGGVLAHSGAEVTFLTRPRVAAELRMHGLTLTDFQGLALRLAPDELRVREDPACLAQADIVLVCVRSWDTDGMGGLIARHSRAKVQVVTLQNGPANAALLRRALPYSPLHAGIVPYGVVAMGQGCFHRAGGGDVLLGGAGGDMAHRLSAPHLQFQSAQNITDLQWGQMLINLGHGISALNGLTLDETLRRRAWRKVLAEQWQEALYVLQSAGVQPRMYDHISAMKTPRTLRLPNGLFGVRAKYMRPVDPQARGQMAQDLLAGRRTEVDSLHGHIVQIADQAGLKAPLNARVADLLRMAEDAGQGGMTLPVSAFHVPD